MSKRSRFRFLGQVALHATFLLVVSIAVADEPTADEPARKAIAVIPEGREKLNSTFEGTHYIRRVLKARYDKLNSRLAEIDELIRSGKLKVSAAQLELDELAAELKDVQRLIEKDKVLISPFKIHTEEVDGAIKLGTERLLVIHADKVKLVGWDKPYAKYVLQKNQLSAEKLDKKLFDRMTVDHKLGSFPEFVGHTAAERKAQEEKFQASPDGKKLTAKQQADRQQFLARIAGGYSKFEVFQGKEFDSLKLTGLTGQEGNRQIQYEWRSPQGARSMGSRWRNHAELTVFVPKCTAVLVRGCQAGLDITGLDTHLILTSAGSRNRDYDGTFVVQKHNGNLTVDNVPLDTVREIKGDVNIESTTELVNHGTRHSGGFRTAYTPVARHCEIGNVEGNVIAHFNRSTLSLKRINGIVNVQNEFGDTDWSITATLPDGMHRIVSSSGLVRVVIDSKTKLGVPIFMATNSGTAKTNLGRKDLDELSVTHTSEHDSRRRSWRAFFTPVGNDVMAKFQLYGRADLPLYDKDRSPGLDLVSRSGQVEFIRE